MIRAQRAGRTTRRSNGRARWIFVALFLALVVGLLACGPAHGALHALVAGDGHADADGSYCTGCSLGGLELPSSVCLFRPALRALDLAVLPPAHVPAAAPLLMHSPRGPPARA
jgi:hypothetical protein